MGPNECDYHAQEKGEDSCRIGSSVEAAIACTHCQEQFASRSALFRHLRRPAANCSAPREDPGEKTMLVIGYDCLAAHAGHDRVGGGDAAASLVMQAMGIGPVPFARPPAGFSQASGVGSRRSPLLAQEVGVSATADNVVMRAPTMIPVESIPAWLGATNAALEGTGVSVLGRMRLMHADLHAEIHATRRRYEYVLPAWLLDGDAVDPWADDSPRDRPSLVPLLQRLRQQGFKPFGHCNGGPNGRRRRCPLWHNFSQDALPHSPSSARRLYRFYTSETFRVGDRNYVCLAVSGDAFLSQQVRGMVALAVAGARGLINHDVIASCIDPSRQEDLLPIPFAPLEPCSLAEVSYSTWQCRLGGICMSPAAKPRAHPPLLGWSSDEDRRRLAEFRGSVLRNAAQWWEARHHGRDWLHDVLVPGTRKLQRELDAANERALNERLDRERARSSSRHRSEDDSCASPPPPSPPLPQYEHVLRLLRQADASGRWPDSTAARSLVISAEGRLSLEADRTHGENTQIQDARTTPEGSSSSSAEQVEQLVGELDVRAEQGPGPLPEKPRLIKGGSFTVGAFPPPCPPPRGNRLFPELARAAFELEGILLPERPPSTTIAVNRHARFKPHVDSGAGAGQSRSLIVGLGDYSGGELVVEGVEEDIRYRPLEFDGWTQRHWTRPFRGERFSLVWFTPKGCEGIAGDARFRPPNDGGRYPSDERL